MSKRRAPRLDERRESDFQRELLERAQSWIPSWGAPEGEPDFAHALLAIAARFNAEVAERLDQGASKMALGFLDWLAIRGQAAIPARMPVVFKLADNAQAVSAPAPVQLQVDAMGTAVVFETETEVRLVPSRLELVVGADSDEDAYYLPPPGLSSLDPLEPLPTEWRIRSFAAPGSSTLQLDPPLGLAPDMLIEIGGQQFRIDAVNEDLVTIDPAVPPGEGFDGASVKVRKVATFDPFGGSARNRQFHALYLGHADLLNIESGATISVAGVDGLASGAAWHYWGTLPGSDKPAWQAFLPGSTAAALIKPKGEMETRKVGEVESRWIRASIARVPAGAPLTSDALTLKVNHVDLTGACPLADAPGGVDGLEAMANNTALEMADIFFPLGREPRQFDAFYLGSAEAFSKRGADVRLCLDMADLTFTSFASMRVVNYANQLLAGVAQDGHLHLFWFTTGSGTVTRYWNSKPQRPPSPNMLGQAAPGLAVALDPRPHYRPALWSRPVDFWRDAYVAVAAGATAWVWRQNGYVGPSGWKPLGTVDPNADPASLINGFVYLELSPSSGMLCALVGTKLFICNPDADPVQWAEVTVTKTGTTDDIELARIVPVTRQLVDLGSGSMTDGLLGVGTDKAVYHITQITPSNPNYTASAATLLTDADVTVAPAGVLRADGALLAVAACDLGPNTKELRACLSTSATVHQAPLLGEVIGFSIDANIASGQLVFAATLQLEDRTAAIAWWSPFNPALSSKLVTTVIPDSVGAPAGAPTLMAQHVLLPALSNQVLVAQFNLAGQQGFFANLDSGVITDMSNLPYSVDDHIAVMLAMAASWQVRKVVSVQSRDGESLYELESPYAEPQTGTSLLLYRSSVRLLAGTAGGTDTIKLDPSDTDTAPLNVLLIDTGVAPSLYQVTGIGAGRVATLDSDHGLAPGTAVHYWRAETGEGVVRPMMTLNPATSGNWDASLLDRTWLTFPGADPEQQRATAFTIDALTHHPVKVALRSAFTTPPAVTGQGVRFVVDGTIDRWSRQLGDTTSNPELSWEYWNGSAWWKIANLHDETLHLKRSGALRFKVPADIEPTDWAGKNNHWIRARLIGGDYGQPRTIVKSTPKPDGSTEQTVQRITDDINAPQVLHLRVQYAASTPVMPTYVLTADSGAVRDQSDANRTPGALVSMFTHLASALPASSGQPQRALYLGFSAELAGQPVNLLVLVDKEQPFDAFAPLRIEALIGEQFVPVVAEDTTRALGESGLLSLSLTLPTLLTGLFGRALCWLRLSPSRPAPGWTPSLRGVYINAAWARAAETMTRERLGSSIGAPGQVLLLARPPLLGNTLELRVREALSGEEREALLLADPASVVSDVASDLRGHWVLWRAVTDVDDAGPLERVYSLDESSGAVRFGDGVHGLIPPIGRDAIVAFSYQRTEPGPLAEVVPANMVAPRTVLNLVTPVEGVEAVFAADQSAGGAPPESAERVQRFAPARLRHRDRALTLRDFEQHALQSSPDIVQARAFGGSGGVRLVIAMRGKQVQPSQAVRRELRRRLLALAPPQLALHIGGPAIRRLRISVTLRVASLDDSGQLANFSKRSLAAFFDQANGALEREGWPIGADPLEDDVALALLDAPALEGIDEVSFEEIASDGTAAPWRHQLRSDELAMLAEDGMRIKFVIVETEP